MLSAVRAMAGRVAQDLAHMDTQRLGPDADSATQDELLAEVLERALEAGKEAVEKGPDQLAVLREAGVVDAGAYGLTILIAGVVAALRGDEAPRLEHHHPPARSLHLPQHESSRYRYCTNFAVAGSGLDASSFVPRLEELGDSVLVVGDEQTLRVHVHTDAPERAVAVFEPVGEVSHMDIGDMREQVADRSARLAGDGAEAAKPAACGVVAVASGAGVIGLYEELGAAVVDGGPTLNPSTYELLAGIHSANAEEVVVLPNSPNVILAAERAAELSEKPARVVPTRSQQQGLASLLAFDPDATATENAAAVAAAAEALRTGGVAVAARDDTSGRFAAGEAVGYVGDELVAWGAPREALASTLARVTEGCEVVTCLAGDGAPLEPGAVAELVPDGIELDFHEGGQPTWWWLLCAE